MVRINLITGQAGTGKTTRLMQRAHEMGEPLITHDYQRLLAMSFMHGARRRLVEKLQKECPHLPAEVTTIDAFAMNIVNRWRRAIGIEKPVTIEPCSVPYEDDFHYCMSFNTILTHATTLLASNTIGNIIGLTYPLVLIDEFQDCDEGHRAFIEQLSAHTTLILAADAYQDLRTGDERCPAVEWVQALATNGKAEIEELTTVHRTSQEAILCAATCLRGDAGDRTKALSPIICPAAGPAAWKMLEKLVLGWGGLWTNDCALICTKREDRLLARTLESFIKQLHGPTVAKHLKSRPIPGIIWRREADESTESDAICEALGMCSEALSIELLENLHPHTLSPIAAQVRSRLLNFARTKGLMTVNRRLARNQVSSIVHHHRAYSPKRERRIVTTVHGAKNREFDHVIILWTPSQPKDVAMRRKLLYNAVTRAKTHCLLLAIGDEKKLAQDPVLARLGVLQPAFPPKQTSSKEGK